MSSKFITLQEDVCEEKTESPEIPEFCETCIPDLNYIAPKWWNTKQPYLNKKTCQYSTVVTINENGETYTHSTIGNAGISFDNLLRTYIKNGVKFMMNYYNKEDTTEISGISLEEYAEWSDYHFYSFADSAMVVLITIPANVFDTISEKPIIDTSDAVVVEELKIDSKKLILYLKQLKSSLAVFSKFQSIFYQLEGGKVHYKDTQEPFYLKFYPKRIDMLIGEIEKIIELNGYAFGLFSSPLDEASELKFIFEFSEDSKEYKIKKIKARKRYGKFRPLKAGLRSFLKSSPIKDPTLLGYLANIKKINLSLLARKSPSWMDFVEQYTYPTVEVKYKSSVISDTGLKCLNEQLSNLDDFIFDQIISFSDAFVYQLNKANKKNIKDLNASPADPDSLGVRISENSLKMIKDRNKNIKKVFDINFKLKNMPDFSDASLRDILSSLNPCKFKEIAATALTCIMGNLDIETSFLAIIKKSFATMTAEGLEILMFGFPDGVRNSITSEVRVKLGNRPAPWEKDYSPGSGDVQNPGTIGNFLTETQADVTGIVTDNTSESEIFKIYEDAIMKFANLQEIMRSFENLPGVSALTRLIGLDFPTTHFITPPIDSFLNTLTFDPCGKEGLSLTLPSLNLPSFPFGGWSWMGQLGRLFFEGLKLTIKNLLIALLRAMIPKILPQFPTIGELDCKALHSNGGKVANILTGRTNLPDLLGDAICSDPLNINEKQNLNHRLMEAAGALPLNFKIEDAINDIGPSYAGGAISEVARRADKSYNISNRSNNIGGALKKAAISTLFPDPEPYSRLSSAISVSSTKNEIIRAMTLPDEEQNMTYFRNMANTIPSAVPEFSNSFDTEEKVKQFFTNLGSKFTPDQRAALQNQVSPDDELLPLEDTICLTSEQLEDWNRERQRAFEESGLNPDIAKEFVDKMNDRIKNDLEDMLDLFSKDPEDLLKDALNKALNIDEKCENPDSLVDITQTPAESIMKDASAGSFKRLQAAFVDDTIEWNFFEITDSPGILSLILADKKGFTLNYHNTIKNNPILKLWVFPLGPLPAPGDDPETVSIQMFKYLNKSKFNYSERKVALDYSNELNGNNLFESKIQYIDFYQNYNSKIIINDPTKRMSFINQPSSLPVSKNPVAKTRALLRKSWSNFRNIGINENKAKALIKNLNSILFDKFAKTLFIREDGTPSHGFIHSNQTEVITKADLTYVGPDGEDYNYEEEEAILGRSLTNNPRVVFLDPSDNGGTYRRPKYFIKPQVQQGWKFLSKIFLSDSAESSKETFLDVPSIVKIMDKARNQNPDPRTSLAPGLVEEAPFDKVASPVKKAFIEGAITATIRIYLADFVIRAMPIVSNVSWDTKNNFDDSLANFIFKNMKDSMIAETHSFRSSYTGYVYWLLFLEQSVEMFNRKYKKVKDEMSKQSGTDPENISSEISRLDAEMSKYDEDLKTIQNIQVNHISDSVTMLQMMKNEYTWNLSTTVNLSDIINKREAKEDALGIQKFLQRDAGTATFLGLSEGIEKLEEEIEALREQETFEIRRKQYGDQLTRGCLLMGYGKEYWKEFGISYSEFKNSIIEIPDGLAEPNESFGFLTDKTFGFKFSDLKTEDANMASKIFSIQSVEASCERILSYLIKEQMDSYKDIIEEYSNPYIKDIHRYFIGASKTFVNSPSLGIEEETYENIKNCVHNPSLENPIDGLSLSTEDLDKMKEQGGLFLEKYLRVIDKEGSVLEDRDELLKGVVNPKHFLDFLKSKKESIDANKPVSEYFGDANIGADILIGSIGLKYGVRICYIPPDDFIDVPSSERSLKSAKENKSFIFKQAMLPNEEILLGSRNIFPLCSYEQDLPDVNLSLYLNQQDDSFGQDIKCYIDRLLESDDYKSLFDEILNIKKIPSIMSMYSYTNFLAALGTDSSEREESDESEIDSNNIGKIFNDSRKELKKMFISSYIREGFDSNDKGSKDVVKKQKDKKMDETLNSTEFSINVSWFTKLRQGFDSPFDSFGLRFLNKYRRLFKFTD